MNKGARKYYEGLARGRDGNWMGLVDAQLKARGHEGLWPKERPPEQDLFAGRTMDGQPIDDSEGTLSLAKAIERASKYPSLNTYWYTGGILHDCGQDNSAEPTSCWDYPDNLMPWVIYN